jgi:transposase
VNDTAEAILFEDESFIRDYQAIKATWFLRGRQKQIKTYGHHAGVGLFGALDYRTGDIMCDTAEQLNTQAFEKFLSETVLPRYTGRRIIMILDNGKIHHAKALQPFMEKMKDRLTFLFLPPYSPRLNRIEGLWRWLKDSVVCNAFLKNQAEIHEAVMKFLAFVLCDLDAVRHRLCW